MDDSLNSADELQNELAYYKKQLDQMSGESIRYDYMLTNLRHELRQKKDAFAVLTGLQRQFSVATALDVLLSETIKTINPRLGMDRSIVLTLSESSQSYHLSYWHGYPADHFVESFVEIHISSAYLAPGKFLLVNKKISPDETGIVIQQNFSINFFVGVPVFDDDRPIAFIICGRQIERLPFSPALDKGDVDTLTAITGLISATLQNKRTVKLQIAKTEAEKENKIITAQRDLLENTLTELKNTQAQLIQSEKMASLGELTAGIAHEIQNPLNFINNFSEVNTELIEELKDQLKTGNGLEALILADDIKTNEQKINHHGKRADAIVKGMLQHSRASSGKKELTDINALADEYLRLSYHGLRAKDKSFNATFITDFDESIGKIEVVPQDIGRVLLNLYNNAFYSISEKKKMLQKQQSNGYESTVSVTTKKEDGKVFIKVSDNGPGIPQKVVDKIFQPFFTTKPTGEGTGLGLSMSYDIIKAHGGEIKVISEIGVGAEFIIQLPVN